MVRPEAIDYLEAGLRAASLRQTVIANNIANLNTPGFRRAEVQFENLLAKALRSGGDVRPQDIRPLVVKAASAAVGPNGSNVDLDTEVGELIKNSMLTKTYFRLLGKLMQQMELAIQP
ncbi:MAG TPA: flagellar basal body rod protein FlgB [Phycisphaerae bacterium]|nr:flagellar basal body rod protein FlgB [Phycisphaerae bacterium]